MAPVFNSLGAGRDATARAESRDEAVSRKDLTVILHLFVGAARLQKKRAALTIASIAWGTVTILLLLAFGEGLKRQFARNQRAHHLGCQPVDVRRHDVVDDGDHLPGFLS